MSKLPTANISAVTTERATQEIRTRFNPLRGLTPQRVTQLREEFARGRFEQAAWFMELVEETDYMIKSVAPKRKKGLSRLPWDIAPYERWEELGSQQQLDEQMRFLRDLYNSIECSHALERDMRGGIRRLIQQMADAIGKRWAVHQLAWEPQRGGAGLRLKATFVPLWFFEATTGNLRFVEQVGQINGKALERDAWMITQGDGIMVACMACYIYKSLPLKDWLNYSERCSQPFPTMGIDAQPGTKEWDEALAAVAQIAAEAGAVFTRGSDFEIHDLTVKGTLPMPGLVDKMDRALSTLWRGADLSTMSGDDRMGASLQQEESDILVEDDVEMVNETLEHAITLPALRWRFGRDVRPMCYFKLKSPDRLDEAAEQAKLHKAADYGVQVPVSDYRERVGIPGAGNESADAGQYLDPPSRREGAERGLNPFAVANAAQPAATDAERDAQVRALAEAMAADRAEIHRALAAVESATDASGYADALQALSTALANYTIDPSQSQFAARLENQLAESVVAGATGVLTDAQKKGVDV